MKNLLRVLIALLLLLPLASRAQDSGCNVGAPSYIQVTNATATTLTFNWPVVTGAVQYQVSLTDGVNNFGPYYTATNSYTATGLQPGTTYTIVVGASACPTGPFTANSGTGTTAIIIVDVVANGATLPSDPGWQDAPQEAHFCMVPNSSTNSFPGTNESAQFMLKFEKQSNVYTAYLNFWADGEGAARLVQQSSPYPFTPSPTSQTNWWRVNEVNVSNNSRVDVWLDTDGNGVYEMLVATFNYAQHQITSTTSSNIENMWVWAGFAYGVQLFHISSDKNVLVTNNSTDCDGVFATMISPKNDWLKRPQEADQHPAERNGTSANSDVKGLKVNPNPFTTDLQMAFPLRQEGPVTVSLFNTLGQRVVQYDLGQVQPEADGLARIILSTKQHVGESGFFVLVVETPEGRYTKMVVKQ
jgi:hypothetical protein